MEELLRWAWSVRERAFAPYSGYRVGAALVDDRGMTFVGTNVENASFGATICAERSAVVAMIADGGRRIERLVVVTKDGGPPCGVCLQVLAEFMSIEAPVLLGDESGAVREHRLGDFLPRPFASAAVERAKS